jgi:hypothetical protein
MRRLHLACYLGLGLSAALFLPVALRAQGQRVARIKCSNNLRQVALALAQYGDDKRFLPHVGRTRDLDGGVETSDSTRTLRALLWYGYLDKPASMVCPAADDYSLPVESKEVRENMRHWFWGGARSKADPRQSPYVDGQPDPKLSETREASYGLTRRGYNRNVSSEEKLAADRAVRDGVSRGALAGNHDDGWNVALADATVSFQSYSRESALQLVAADKGGGYLGIKDQRDDSGFKPLSRAAPPQTPWRGWYRAGDTLVKLEEGGFDRRSGTWGFRGEIRRGAETQRVLGRTTSPKRVEGQEAKQAGGAFVAVRRGEDLEVTWGGETRSFKLSSPPPPPLDREAKRLVAMGLLVALKTGNLDAAEAFMTAEAVKRLNKAGGAKSLREKIEGVSDRELRGLMRDWSKLVVAGKDGVGRVDLGEKPVAEAKKRNKPSGERAAIGALKTLSSAQSLFREADKEGDGILDYAENLGELAKVGYIDAVLGSGRKLGYTFQLCNGSKAPEFTWMAVASPITSVKGSPRHLAINHQGVIYTSPTAFKLDRESCEIKGGTVLGR